MFTQAQCDVTWTVPDGVHVLSIRMWGAGGGSTSIGSNPASIRLGGTGAYVEGLAYVTPGEAIRVVSGSIINTESYQSGCNSQGCSGCGYSIGGLGNRYYYQSTTCAPGGGGSSVLRWNAVFEQWQVIAVAGGGGGACDAQGLPGQAISSDGNCGTYAPQGGSSSQFTIYSEWQRGGGGGGGWTGGAYTANGQPGGGGSSCAPGLVEGTVSSVAADAGQVGAYAVNELSPFWQAGAGRSDGTGLVVFTWSSSADPSTASDVSNWSASRSAAATASPTPFAGAYCALCQQNSNASICCDCCLNGVFQPGLCNAPKYASCLPAASPVGTRIPSPSGSWTSRPSDSTSNTATNTRTSTGTSVPTYSSAVTPTSASTPIPSSLPWPDFAYTEGFSWRGDGQSCDTQWTVPNNTYAIVVRLWGAGGGRQTNVRPYPPGGTGAFVKGLVYVTPGETLLLSVGQAGSSSGSAPNCGGGGAGVGHIYQAEGCWYCGAYYGQVCGSGGGATSISRWNAMYSQWEPLAVAGGGGGACEGRGESGTAAPSDGDCGEYQPQGGTGTPATSYWDPTRGGGGGGGWIGGAYRAYSAPGGGGSSCARGLDNRTVVSVTWKTTAEVGDDWGITDQWGMSGGWRNAISSGGSDQHGFALLSYTPGETFSSVLSPPTDRSPSPTPSPSPGSYCAWCASILAAGANVSTSAICCDCCDGAVFQPALCNGVRYAHCVPALTASYTRSPSPTSSITSSVTATSTATFSATFTPKPTAAVNASFGTDTVFTAAVGSGQSCDRTWTVPAGIRQIALRMWGAGGSGGAYVTYSGGKDGGLGAYVEGMAFVTPGETLMVRVGTSNANPRCGGGGDAGALLQYSGYSGYRVAANCGAGGGASSILRYNLAFEQWQVIAMAGGGGGGCSVKGGNALPAPQTLNISCGNYAPTASGGTWWYDSQPDSSRYGGGGGGGWTGGWPGQGGTSCAPGLREGTILSLGAPPDQADFYAVFEGSRFWRPSVGRPNGDGLVVLSYGEVPSASATRSSSGSFTPSLSASITVSPSRTGSGSSTPSSSLSGSGTPSITPSESATSSRTPSSSPTATSSACHETFRGFAGHDIVGSTFEGGGAALYASETECKQACCALPACTGYAFSRGLSLMSAGAPVPCYLLTNVTQLIPNNNMAAGVRESAFAS